MLHTSQESLKNDLPKSKLNDSEKFKIVTFNVRKSQPKKPKPSVEEAIEYKDSEIMTKALNNILIKDDEDADNYDLHNQKILLSYPGLYDKETLSNFIAEKVYGQVSEIKNIFISHEDHGIPAIDATHVLIDLGKRFRTRNNTYFKYNDMLPTIRLILNKLHWDKAANFLADIDNENEFLKKNSLGKKIGISKSRKELLLEHMEKPSDAPGLLAAYDILHEDEEIEVKKLEHLYSWQETTLEITEKEPNDRGLIYWFYGKEGAEGKTELVRFLLSLDKNKYKFVNKLGSRDLSNTVKGWIKDEKWKGDTILVNLVRSEENKKIYEGLEMLADHMATAEKYHGGSFTWRKCHILVFSNFLPKLNNTLSVDRWRIFSLYKLWIRDGHFWDKKEGGNIMTEFRGGASTSESETRIQPWMNDTMDVGFECLELEDVNRISEQDEESYKEEELYQKEREKILERKRKEKIQERLMKDFPEEFEVKASPKSKSLKDSSKENMINPSPKIKTSSLKDRIRIV